ncbi:MAG TPA: transporter [Gammaproteobacteria bacterium]|nr:transporter [Gammaproteobacteria bacterium]
MAKPTPATTYTDTEYTWSRQYARFVMRFRWPVMIGILILTILAGLFIKDLDIRNDPDTLLPPTNRYVATNLYGEQKFGMGNLMVLGFIVKEGADIYQPWFLNMVQDVHNKMVALPNSRGYNFMDIGAQKIKYMGAKDGSLVFKRLMPVEGISTTDPALAKKQMDFLKAGLEDNPVLAPMLVYKEDANGNRCEYGQKGCVAKGTFIIGDYDDGVKAIYLPWVDQVVQIKKELEAKYGDKVEILIAGEPYFLAYMLRDLVQKWWLFAISLAIVFFILWRVNKGWRGAVFPLLGVGSTIVLTLGLMGLTQFKLTTMMVLTPMLLLAIGTGHAIQITRRFLNEMLETNCDPYTSAENAIAHTIIPATLAVVTDMVGFATLSTVDISFYKAYAWFGMFGMATLLMTTTTLIPLMMSKWPPHLDPVQDRRICEPSRFEKWFARMSTNMLSGPLKWIPVIIVLVIIGWSAKETKILEGTLENPMPGVERGINYPRAAFKERSITIQDINRLGQVMPGVISVNIPFKSKEPLKPECIDEDENGNLLPPGCHDPDTMGAQGIMNNADALAAIEKMEDWMRAHPYIGFTGSYIQYIKLVNMLLVSKEDNRANMDLFHVPNGEFLASNLEYYKDPEDPDYVPDGDQIVQMYNGLLEANTSPGDLDSFVSSDWNEGVIMGFVNTVDPVKTHQVVVDIHKYMREHQNDPGMKLLDFGLKNGQTVTMPETHETITVTGDPAITDPGLGGFLGATEATREVAEANWLKGPLQTALAIFIIAAIMFRSFIIAGLLIVILMITLFAQYGLGGYFTAQKNWSGNLAFHLQVALSIAMGLGVDYSIYIVSRLREEMAYTAGKWREALYNTLSTTGGAVFASVIVLLGSFIPLVATELANTWGLSMYIGQALIIDVVTALTFLPLLVYWLKPKYIFAEAGKATN